MNLGEYIKNKRLEKNISLNDFSNLINYSVSGIENIESGKQKYPKSVILYRISKILEIDYDKLLDYKFSSYYKNKEFKKINRMMRYVRV